MCENIRAPPYLEKSVSYEVWVKEVRMWQKLTSLPKGMQGSAIFLTLDQTACGIVEIYANAICSDLGVENIISQLNKLYLLDELATSFEICHIFETYQRTESSSIDRYTTEYQSLLEKAQQCGLGYNDSIIAYKLLKSACLSEDQEDLIKRNIAKFSYDAVRYELSKVFGSLSGSSISLYDKSSDNISQCLGKIVKIETKKIVSDCVKTNELKVLQKDENETD